MARTTGSRVSALKSIEAAAASRSRDGIMGSWAALASATLLKTSAWYKVEVVKARQESRARGLKQSLTAVRVGRGVE
jgi:hypothetical protein